MEVFGERIKKLRESKGFTQRQLAKEIGFVHSAIALWESNNRTPSLEVAKVFAKYFNVSIDYLAGLTDKK